MNDKVVLYHPPYDGTPLGAPLSLLSLASPLLEAGFHVRIVDAVLDSNVEDTLEREIQDAACFGVTLLTGPMIANALQVSSFVRKRRPDICIVFGGWHPSLTPEQTLANPLVDVIVRGQGEVTMRELALCLRNQKPLEGLRGVSFKSGREAVHNPDRPVENINKLPMPAFALANVDAYESVTGVRRISFASSLGCPYACHYCTDQVFYERRFNAYTASRVASDLPELVDRYRLDEVALADSNFLVNVRRAVGIARGILDSKVRFGWTFQASTDFLCDMSDEDVMLLAEAGVTHMGFGTESASENVLVLMNKRHQRIDEMFETARKAELAGIRVTFNVILGYPGESEDDRLQTFRLLSEIARRHANVSFSPNIFTPYPGLAIWPQLRELGVHEPQSLEEWADVDLGSNHLPWLQGDALRRLRRMLEYFLLNNQIRRSTSAMHWGRRGVRVALGAPVRWRLKKNVYSFPWELWVARTTERLTTRRSLLTGTPLNHSVREVC